jgi:hypothetical protein
MQHISVVSNLPKIILISSKTVLTLNFFMQNQDKTSITFQNLLHFKIILKHVRKWEKIGEQGNKN